MRLNHISYCFAKLCGVSRCLNAPLFVVRRYGGINTVSRDAGTHERPSCLQTLLRRGGTGTRSRGTCHANFKAVWHLVNSIIAKFPNRYGDVLALRISTASIFFITYLWALEIPVIRFEVSYDIVLARW